MKKTGLKQGTLKWENAKATRIGSSEVFDIVRYYATDDELQNCGINAEKFRAEKPYTSAWALFHKLKNDGIYQREELPPELAEYGHAVEPYGLKLLQFGRRNRLKPGSVFASDRLIASLDISGVSEGKDIRAFDYGGGQVLPGKSFVCEQKSMMPYVVKNGLPFKYIIQAQYQITMTKADFYILQIMILDNDTPFERGKIVQMSKAKRAEYLTDKMNVTYLYFRNNEHLAMLIKTCLERFFADVDNDREPTPYIEHDSQRNIVESIRINSFYNDKLVVEHDFSDYIKAKDNADNAEFLRKLSLQRVIETAKHYNASRFVSPDGVQGSFSKSGAFLLKFPKD